MAQNVFKVVLVGDGGVGKTCYLTRLCGGSFELRYQSTVGVRIASIGFDMSFSDRSNRKVWFNVWDTDGQEKLSGLKDGYYVNADAAIVMYDVSSRLSYRNVDQWIRDVKRVCPNIPIVVVGNKSDIPDSKVHDTTSIRISTKTGRHLTKPFNYLTKYLLDRTDIKNFLPIN